MGHGRFETPFWVVWVPAVACATQVPVIAFLINKIRIGDWPWVFALIAELIIFWVVLSKFMGRFSGQPSTRTRRAGRLLDVWVVASLATTLATIAVLNPPYLQSTVDPELAADLSREWGRQITLLFIIEMLMTALGCFLIGQAANPSLEDPSKDDGSIGRRELNPSD